MEEEMEMVLLHSFLQSLLLSVRFFFQLNVKVEVAEKEDV
jgi:hypothetical protein